VCKLKYFIPRQKKGGG